MNTFYKIVIILSSCLLALGSMQAQIITTFAGSGIPPNNYGYSGDGGQATNAELYNPNGITIDAIGNLYIADSYNNRIRKVNTLGIITTIAGNGTSGYSGDGGQATNAELNAPTGIVVDAFGNLYIADVFNYVIRKINVTSNIISTIAGTGVSGYSGDGGAATVAKLSAPRQMAFDTAGNLYFTDEANYVIRKITLSTGIITTVAGIGTQGYSGDGGQAIAAELGDPRGLCFDKSNNLYVTDIDTNVVRKVTASTGIITTVVGNSHIGYSGDGGQATTAELEGPEAVIADSLGNLYIADSGNSVIRKVNTLGIINTIAGNDTYGYSGDGGPAILAVLYGSGHLVLDAHNNLYLIDFGNQRVRKISNVSSITGVQTYNTQQATFKMYPNPNSGSFTLTYNIEQDATIAIYDMQGKQVFNLPLTAEQTSVVINNLDLQNGAYMYKVLHNGTMLSGGKLIILK